MGDVAEGWDAEHVVSGVKEGVGIGTEACFFIPEDERPSRVWKCLIGSNILEGVIEDFRTVEGDNEVVVVSVPAIDDGEKELQAEGFVGRKIGEGESCCGGRITTCAVAKELSIEAALGECPGQHSLERVSEYRSR